MTEKERISRIVEILREAKKEWAVPVVTLMGQMGTDPFKILVATVLSLRTKDEVTAEAARRLFQVADTPEKLLKLSEEEIASLIYPVGFYNRKAKNLKEIARILVEHYGGQVPSDLEELLKLPGVGRKTANLVVTQGFKKPGICVDTHVHRIMNRLGFVKTKTPEETEFALREKLPKEFWIEINDLLVALGQHICRPISPKCSQCPIEHLCKKVGVKRSR
ncbi:DNA-(apurinic or apyrimidinic site) lyase [Thermovibrio ammonificans HB-1]|uniref:Endonuclease III n=1 Tax=Thermovibrio ammonificans (strain DSM 15698 / JCM 12110 / HB-1) TaxID=648996 RepID=E8T2U6_THEA1|nr:endonuclease III [Thermovibrio ammonificans]ADU97155.1 DNA-(apurinic or apyrimidinic site) lyase [Thermovibrio ammonificans HB-1]